jgi:uncharacterized protein YprB with RNaseH-like and TPR domain
MNSLSADKFSRLAALKPAQGARTQSSSLQAPADEDTLGRTLGATLAKNKYGEHLSLRNWYSTPDEFNPSPTTLDLLTNSRKENISEKHFAAISNPENWLFLDTETTGLAGGTGTYAFLIGLAWWDAGGLQVEQFFMRDFTDEYSVLQELSTRISERPVLVTFNGKSFDWPLLESRFTMTRAIRTPKLAAHLDLLHPARALWKLRLGSVRLVELERHVLDSKKMGWHREDDVPSSQIPQFYFDYLRGGSPEPLAAVARHNQMDLRGLAALFAKIDSMLSGSDYSENQIESLDLFGLSKFLNRRGEAGGAHSACEKAIAIGLPVEIQPQAKRDLALMAKRRGEHPRAAELWLNIISNSSSLNDSIHSCEQLAIYYERQEKNFSRAAEFVKLGIAKLRQQHSFTIRTSRDPYAAARILKLEVKFQQRLARLQKKLNSAAPEKSPLLSRSQTA